MNLSLLCETVTGTTTAELVAARDAATRADMVELRLDGVTDPDISRVLHERCVPVIVTCRPRWEGGRFDGSEEERRRLLTSSLESGAEHVDIEWRADFATSSGHPHRVVVSSHDFAGVPDDPGASAGDAGDGCDGYQSGHYGRALVRHTASPRDRQGW